ncbi:MAG TPA: DUF2127 domain-containing protein [Gemmatimonadaceae bacterium]|nr:DUF2127 domain-containing protein [Gemmatimonadaceae bacterium]
MGYSSETPDAAAARDASAHELGLRTVAVFEAAKGFVVLVAGSGLLLLVRRDAQAMAERIVEHLHLDPASRYPHIFLQLATGATPGRLRLLAFGALVYALIRFAEAVGLWHGRRWAEWFGMATGAVYLPFEVVALVRHPSIEPVVALIASVGIVVFLAVRLKKGGRHRRT